MNPRHGAPTGVVDMTIDDAQFARVAAMITALFGIQVPPAKRELLVTRLRKLVAESGHSTFEAFYREHLAGTPSKELLGRLVDRVSTNHTFFWREPAHLEHFRDAVLPELRRGADGDVRVWCAAAATGEEPWTLAMLITEALEGLAWQGGLLATDISADALAVAERGVYKADAVDRLPSALARRWLVPERDGAVSIAPALRREVTWRRLNLVGAAFPFKRPMHAVFCRNVMIYFDEPTRRDVVRRIAEVTRIGGWLYIGHSETLGQRDPHWRFERPGVYRRFA